MHSYPLVNVHTFKMYTCTIGRCLRAHLAEVFDLLSFAGFAFDELRERQFNQAGRAASVSACHFIERGLHRSRHSKTDRGIFGLAFFHGKYL